jgi:hypothetical protein
MAESTGGRADGIGETAWGNFSHSPASAVVHERPSWRNPAPGDRSQVKCNCARAFPGRQGGPYVCRYSCKNAANPYIRGGWVLR